jgi:hypothetical protein
MDTDKSTDQERRKMRVVPSTMARCASPGWGIANWLDGAQDADREHEDRSDEREDAGDGDTDEAEWKRDDPDDRIEQQRDEREWPAEKQQNAEE